MNYYSSEKLELPKVLARLKALCSSSLGKELVEELTPSADLAEVLMRQKETTEAVNCLRLYPNFNLGGVRDIRNHLWRVNREGVLDPNELIEILDTLQGSRKLKSFFLKTKNEFKILRGLSDELHYFTELEREIQRCISEDGKIKDDASPVLYSLRRKTQNLQENINRKLEQIIRSEANQKALQENLITIRNDRYVLPIKQEYRSRFPGLVHDQSASGATLFIEPMVIVEMNNDLKELNLEEKAEVRIILKSISKKVGLMAEEIRASLEVLGRFDFIFAKARLSYEMRAAEPKFNQKGHIRLVKGRHPLLTGKVVPLDLELGNKFDSLIITGPNTGGKTVALKTTGLLSLMGQCGLHVPAAPETELSLFDQIFADIGDEQSIEQSLSTFSSHMKNLVFIVKNTTSTSLVLLDELGAGTDPAEGSALAMSILKKLHSLGAKIVATTHYSELKAFAYNTDRMENASVEFDPISLRPTYRLLIGTPGRSNAFEIAARLGLDSKVVELARTFISKEELEIGSLLEELESRRQKLQEEQTEIGLLEKELKDLREKIEAEQEALHEKEQEILKDAQKRGRKLVSEAESIARTLITELKEAIRKQKIEEQEDALIKARKRLQDLREKRDTDLKVRTVSYKEDAPKTVSVGEEVFLKNLNQKGTVLSSPNNQGEVQVQVGILKVQVALTELRPIEAESPKEGATTISKLMLEKSSSISKELDLRGQTVDEAIEKAEKYLDDAFLSSLPTVFLIHGKGTGALRTAVSALLQDHPHVKSYRLGSYGEGGTGVTVVNLRR